MKNLHSAKSPIATDELYALACGPDNRVWILSGCICKGIRFHTLSREQSLRTQSSGVVVRGEHHSEDTDFYGVLGQIIRLDYVDDKCVYLFRCDWWNVGNSRHGIRVGKHFTSVDVSRKRYVDDPFVLASQASQCFYLSDTKLRGTWKVVQRVDPRSVYDVLEKKTEADVLHDVYQHEEQIVVNEIQDEEIQLNNLERADVASDEIEASLINKIKSTYLQSTAVDEDEGEDDTLIDYFSEKEDSASSDGESDLDE